MLKLGKKVFFYNNICNKIEQGIIVEIEDNQYYYVNGCSTFSSFMFEKNDIFSSYKKAIKAYRSIIDEAKENERKKVVSKLNEINKKIDVLLESFSITLDNTGRVFSDLISISLCKDKIAELEKKIKKMERRK